MKKINLFVIAALISVISINAQDDNDVSKKATFGAKLGYSSITLKVKATFEGESESDSENVSGFYLGLYSNIPLSEKLDLQPELNYSGYSEDGESTGVLHLPILLRYSVDERFALLAGPQLDYLVEEEDAAGLKRVGVGIAAGITFDVTDELFIDARYSFGLNDRLSDDFIEGFEEVDIKSYFNYLHVGIGYRFQ